MASSPIADTGLISFNILSNGANINSTIEVISIEVTVQANAVDEAIITVSEANGNFEVTRSKTFRLDTNIEIKLGYDDKNQCAFKGVVAQQRIIMKDGLTSLRVICKNIVHGVEEIRPQLVDRYKEPVLELTFGDDIMEAELDIPKTESETITGYIRCQGSTKANVNEMISIYGTGKKYSDRARIDGVLHKVEQGNWLTTLNLGTIVNF